MAKNRLSDLRNHLFETIELLKDPDNPMDLERAKAISAVAQTIINSAAVEVNMARAICASAPASPEFFGLREEGRELPKIPESRRVT